mgnify:CR=1 FL=1
MSASARFTEDFAYEVLSVVAEIPEGTVATYGQIALLCQKPKNSRQIGYALRTGKLGENIPAHRILNASGILSGAASFETYDQQKLLLESEGVTVIHTDKGWKTDLKKYQWKTTFDDALYFENLFKQANI